MRAARGLLPAVLFLLACLQSGGAFANACNEADAKYAAFWDNAYDPEEAHAFGLQIQQILLDKNLSGLFDLVAGELANGPRKRFAATKTFDQMFDPAWVRAVLTDPPPCQPVGWRGFMLGSGRIWYHRDKDGWHLFSINGALQEPVEMGLPIGWREDGELLPFECFYYDNFATDRSREYAKQHEIRDFDDFLANPGKYLGMPIPLNDKVSPDWCQDNYCKDHRLDETIALSHRLSECRTTSVELTVLDRLIWRETGGVSYQYEVIGRVRPVQCARLAPHLDATCNAAYLLAIGDYSGGTIGWLMQYTIYGLFTTKDDTRYIAPLKSFNNRNEALNFTEDLR
ncbi:MAG: hypothetical protein EP348_10370 [Alphaproteobacteria bacterium]|nr:MAG: hypothetical protein EP348_10370 [Alphaproteobacteria bacterium]